MTTRHTVYRTAGDTGDDIYSELEGVDITNITITLAVRLESGGQVIKNAIVDNAAEGTFHFKWDAGDLVEGVHEMEYVLVDANQTPAATKRLPSESTMALIVRAQA